MHGAFPQWSLPGAAVLSCLPEQARSPAVGMPPAARDAVQRALADLGAPVLHALQRSGPPRCCGVASRISAMFVDSFPHVLGCTCQHTFAYKSTHARTHVCRHTRAAVHVCTYHKAAVHPAVNPSQTSARGWTILYHRGRPSLGGDCQQIQRVIIVSSSVSFLFSLRKCAAFKGGLGSTVPKD